jgi:FkbM family methyltransferase
MKFTSAMVPHVRQILAGEYLIEVSQTPETVLDIGGNEGAFTAWARKQWPGAFIKAFEPVPANADIFELNHGLAPRITLVRKAVADKDTVTIYLGESNSGCASMYRLGEQRKETIQVHAIHPKDIGSYDYVKIDAEGAELMIVSHLDLSKTWALVLEYHRDEDILPIIERANSYGLMLVGHRTYCPNRGLLKFKR